MHPDAETIIRAVQPSDKGDETLWRLHRLDINDKHRMLITAAVGIAAWGGDMPNQAIDQSKGIVLWFDRVFGGTFSSEPRAEIVNFPTSTYQRQKPEDFKVGLDITFGANEMAAYEPVLSTLANMLALVETKVMKFAHFFGGTELSAVCVNQDAHLEDCQAK